jgi:hypothetical protein
MGRIAGRNTTTHHGREVATSLSWACLEQPSSQAITVANHKEQDSCQPVAMVLFGSAKSSVFGEEGGKEPGIRIECGGSELVWACVSSRDLSLFFCGISREP